MTLNFTTMAQARAGFKDLLDSAVAGQPATVNRDRHTIAAVDAARLAHALRTLIPCEAYLESDSDGWSFYIDGLPISAYGDAIDDVLNNAVDALRDYADLWETDLKSAPNHAENWSLVQLVALSSDIELRKWITGQHNNPDRSEAGQNQTKPNNPQRIEPQ